MYRKVNDCMTKQLRYATRNGMNPECASLTGRLPGAMSAREEAEISSVVVSAAVTRVTHAKETNKRTREYRCQEPTR